MTPYNPQPMSAPKPLIQPNAQNDYKVDASDLPRIRELEAKLSTATFQLQITELDPNGKDGPEGMKKQVEADLKKKK